jgi:hypothetical protein
MKKTILASAIALIISGSAMAQPVSDRAVIPIGVTLNQILRIHVINGGNIEFVFNSITDYTSGIANGATGFYDSQVVIASSTDWDLHMGTEEAVNMVGTDNPANVLNINNVGFTATWTGTNTCCTALTQVSGVTGNYDTATSGGAACGLKPYTGGAADLLYQDAGIAAGSGGSVLANAFTINWECGTLGAGTTPMAITSLLAQSPAPDRYTCNVFLDLTAN